MSFIQKVYLQLLSLLFLPMLAIYAQGIEEYNCVIELPPGGSQQEPLADQRGGKFIPAQDTFHVLVVFVQFPDDNFDVNNPNWPKGQPPAYVNTFIDSVASQNSQNGNMSHYFRAMSMDRFKLTGKAYHVYTPKNRQWYKDNNKKYWDINRDVLLRVDSMISFAPFDNWIRGTNYIHSKGQDGKVDMVFLLYRNVWADDEVNYRTAFLFRGAQADLGGIGDIWVDNNTRRIQTYSLQSGTTSLVVHSAETLNLPPYRAQIHELAHFFFFGSNADHNGGGFWAMLNAWTFRHNSQRQSCANSYERELVGWIAPESLYATTYNVTMTDYATTGRAIKIKVPGSNPNEFFRLEYHTRASQFDTPEMYDANAKGLYILHQTGIGSPEDGFLRLLPGDGRWTWVSNELAYPSYYSSGLAVYKKSTIDRVNGYDDSRQVPFTWTGPPPTPTVPNPSWIHFYRDRQTNQLIEQTVFRGDGKDAFTLTKSNIFSPWSNPNSQNNLKAKTWITIELTNELPNGTAVLNVYFDSLGAVSVAPSKTQDLLATSVNSGSTTLSWTANIEPDMLGYNIYRGIVYAGSGEPSYVKINSIPITTTTYTDNNYESITGLPQNIDLYHRYRITAVDNQGKESVKSEYVDAYFTHIASGIISSNKTLMINVNVLDDVTVQNGVTLKINPGTRVVFENGKTLTVNGKLNASGTSSQPITFTSAKTSPSPGDWSSIVLKGGPNTLKYCNIQYATDGITVNSTGGTTIENCNVRYSSNYGIYGVNCMGYGAIWLKGVISENNNRGLGLINAWAAIVASNEQVTNIRSNNHTGIYTNSAYAYIHHTTINNNGGYGVSINGNSNIYFTTTGGSGQGWNTIKDNITGQIEVKQWANVFLGLKTLYCDCGGITKSASSISPSSIDKCVSPCYWRWYESGGYNSISGNGFWVWNNSYVVYAHLNFWDEPTNCYPPAGKFDGNVERFFPLCYPELEKISITDDSEEITQRSSLITSKSNDSSNLNPDIEGIILYSTHAEKI